MSHNKKESKNKEDVKEEVPKDDSIKDSAVTSQPMPSTAAGDKETSSERIEAGDKETTLEAKERDDPSNWTNEWHEPRWQDCGGEVDKLNVRLLGCCFCEANMSNSASLGVMEIDESGDRKYPYCGLFWLVGVLGIWLPWRPETYVLRRATRRRYKIKGTTAEDIMMASVCLCCCANCQIIRETQEQKEFVGYSGCEDCF